MPSPTLKLQIRKRKYIISTVHNTQYNVKKVKKKKTQMCHQSLSSFCKKRGLQQSIPFVSDINESGYCVPIL